MEVPLPPLSLVYWQIVQCCRCCCGGGGGGGGVIVPLYHCVCVRVCYPIVARKDRTVGQILFEDYYIKYFKMLMKYY